MSAHGDHSDEHAADHDDHDDDHHAAPPLEEPATPLWLTLLGIGLFLAGGIVFVATRDDGKTTAELTAAGEAEAAQPGDAPAAAPAPNPAAVPAPGRRPGGGSKQPGHEGHDHD